MSIEETNMFQQSLGDPADTDHNGDEPQRHDMSIGDIVIDSDSDTDVSYAP